MSFNENTELHIKCACLLEYDREREEHGDKFHSMHEGYAILKEEVEEAASEFGFLKYYLEEMWESIKKNEEVFISVDCVKDAVIRAMMELAQVWALFEKIEADDN